MFMGEVTRALAWNKEGEGEMDERKENRREEGTNLVGKENL